MDYRTILKQIGIFSTLLGVTVSSPIVAQDNQQNGSTTDQQDLSSMQDVKKSTKNHGGAGIEGSPGTQSGDEPKPDSQGDAGSEYDAGDHGGADIEGSTGTQSGDEPKPDNVGS